MTQQETERALYETRLVLHRLIKSFDQDRENFRSIQKTRVEQAELILRKYNSVKDVLRTGTNQSTIKP